MEEITWNLCAAEALCTLDNWHPKTPLSEWDGDTIVARYDAGQRMLFGAAALVELEQNGITKRDILDLLVRKQKDYGCENINRFGTTGLDVRLWDKLARLINLRKNGNTPENESYLDTLMDIVGYTVIREMVLRDKFNLPVV